MSRFSVDQTTYIQTKFLEWLAGAPCYRRTSSAVELFGHDIFHIIPRDWYDQKGGKLRLSLAGWEHLTANGRVHHIHNITALLRAGRVTFSRAKGDWFWVKPVYLSDKKGVK